MGNVRILSCFKCLSKLIREVGIRGSCEWCSHPHHKTPWRTEGVCHTALTLHIYKVDRKEGRASRWNSARRQTSLRRRHMPLHTLRIGIGLKELKQTRFGSGDSSYIMGWSSGNRDATPGKEHQSFKLDVSSYSTYTRARLYFDCGTW